MKTFISSIIGFIFLGSIVSAQMTTFSQGDILSAGSMNQNFKHLQDQFSLNKKEIDCSTDNLTQKINQGYNHLVIDGNCSVKNLFMGLFDISPYCGHSQANNKIQRLMISGKTGKSSDTLTINGSANCDSQIGVFHGASLNVSDITINSRSIMASNSGNIRMRNVIVAGSSSDSTISAQRVGHIQLENFTTTTHGIVAEAGSNLEADNMSVLNLEVQRNSSAYIKNSTINCSAKDINCVKVQIMSSISFESTTITGGANKDAIVLWSTSQVDLQDSTVNSTKSSSINVAGPYSVLNADSNTTINGTVTCGNNVNAFKDGTNLCQ